MVEFTSESSVERVYLDGKLGAVNSARISFDNWKSQIDSKDEKLIEYLKKHNHKSPFFHPQVVCLFADKEDVNKFLLNEYDKDLFAGIEVCGVYVRFSMYSYEILKDNLPAHAIVSNPNNQELNELIAEYGLKKATQIPYLSFRVSCPIFVRNQLDRHRIGFAFNEVSRRYVNTEPKYWHPKKWRKQSQNNKQASIEYEFVEESGIMHCFLCSEYHTYANNIKFDDSWYKKNLKNGMCREQARAVLPLATFTSFVWTGSLEDYARVYKERVSPLAQIETKEVALAIGKVCELEYPDAWKQLIK